jgi:hypothetical protein
MKDSIIQNLNNPAGLESLYRSDKTGFKLAFKDLFPQLQDNLLASYWQARLDDQAEEISWGNRKDLVFVIFASILAYAIAKLPAIFGINEEFFFTRNIGFIIFPALSAYFAWKNKLSFGLVAFVAMVTIGAAVFINSLPDESNNSTTILSCIHLILVLWSLLGIVYIGSVKNNHEKRLGFLKFNGGLLVMTGLILIAGAILSAITIGLFTLIGLDIRENYIEYVGILGLVVAPILGTYLTEHNPQLVGKVSPVIAKIFAPLVLVMLIAYLVAIFFAGKDPYNDREFLLIFNILLIGVMAIIFFSIAETSKTTKTHAETWILLFLSVVTIIVNSIALSAILFRISSWGLTPNRAAVLGGNLLILVNLLLVSFQVYRVLSKKADITAISRSITSYLPAYFIWTIVVTFLFPVIFGFK